MADMFTNVADRTNPADRWYSITPNDAADLAVIPRAILCTAAGNLVAVDAAGTSLTVALTAGQFLPIRPTRVGTASTGSFAALY